MDYDRKLFRQLWNVAPSIRHVMAYFNISREVASNRAAKMRREGYKLKIFIRGRRKKA